MNNIRKNILRTIGLLLVGTFFQTCQEDTFGSSDRASLIKQGRYLVARDAQTADLNKATYFKANTPYRLVAFSKPYKKGGTDDNDRATLLRFNQVGWEGELSDGDLHFINLANDPDKWLGFSPAVDGEPTGDDGLTSLDFYGFTYGNPETEHPDDYILLEGKGFDSFTHTETVDEQGKLKDLRYGQLLNQNIETAGANVAAGLPAQSVLPFKHSFSQLKFQTVQQRTDNKLQYEDLSVEEVKITNTYKSGTVNIKDGKVKVQDKGERNLAIYNADSAKVVDRQKGLGDIIVFPSDASGLSDYSGGDGYEIGLEITIKGRKEEDIENFLKNTGSQQQVANEKDGMYEGVINVAHITNSNTLKPLFLKQNTTYTIVLSFMDNTMRIITVIPKVEEWLPGEGNSDDPWQNQVMGQPQVFDNLVWSDRNLGARDYDPGRDFEGTIGYYYQSNRNIPYWPFVISKYPDANFPTVANRWDDHLLGAERKKYYVFPIVDPQILVMPGNSWRTQDANTIQWDIPKAKENGNYAFAFPNLITYSNAKHWEKGPSEQPVPAGWEIPTAEQFATIFPTTPFAGNLTFRTSDSKDPSSWAGGVNDKLDESVKFVRVCVPYYDPKGTPPPNSTMWNFWKEHDDIGTTTDIYRGDAAQILSYWDPQGDPSPGYASVYLISREREDVDEFTLDKNMDSRLFLTRKWGTIYAIKKVYTNEAYRMRWRVRYTTVNIDGKDWPGMYIEVCRYTSSASETLTAENYQEKDWDHPVARIYIPVSGLCRGHSEPIGAFYNAGTECFYATSSPLEENKCKILRIKITGDSYYSQYIAIVGGEVPTHGKQLRLVRTK